MHQTEHDSISRRAYFLWEAHGQPPGRADEFWYAAEAELSAQRAHERGDRARGSDILNLNDGPDITNMDKALSPDARRRARSERHAESDVDNQAAATSFAAPHFLVLLDRAHLRIYLDESESTAPVLAAAFDQPAGKQSYSATESDQAGRFAGSQGTPTKGAGPAGGSIDERLPLKEEHDRKLARGWAERLDAFFATAPTASTWDYAAGPGLHNPVLNHITSDTRERLRKALLKDLVNQPPSELREYFKQSLDTAEEVSVRDTRASAG